MIAVESQRLRLDGKSGGIGLLSRRRAMGLINLIGGLAVLGSYAYCMTAYSEQVGDFWGGVPDGLRSVYTVNMALAAAGYFAFTYFLMYRFEPATGERLGIGSFNALYAMILVPSALWMPLTFGMLESPSAGLWLAIRATLAVVGIGSIGLLIGLVAVRHRHPELSHKLAVAGSAAFCCQTAILDAIVWPAYFPV